LVIGQLIGQIDDLPANDPARRGKNAKENRNRHQNSSDAADPALQPSNERRK
jgi:hypothetical protein